MKYVIILMCTLGLLVACSKEPEFPVKTGKYGLLSDETPQYSAVIFMHSIYMDKTLDRAIKLSTERFGRILKGHHTNKNVQRRVFSLRLDTLLETEPVSGGARLFAERQETAEIEMKIIGEYNGRKYIELKTLSMVKIKGDWRVSKVSNTVP